MVVGVRGLVLLDKFDVYLSGIMCGEYKPRMID